MSMKIGIIDIDRTLKNHMNIVTVITSDTALIYKSRSSKLVWVEVAIVNNSG
jgi:hypothetical protein